MAKQTPWTDAQWGELRAEIENGYKTGEWFSGVGAQTKTAMSPPADISRQLGLDPSKKTAVIFAHIFWDSTFFWGEDLFRNFEDWFRHLLRTACANPAVNWVIKVHPANMVKNRRDRYDGEQSEIKAIRETVGSLPPHVRLLPAETKISTLSLFPAIDYCLTVRGTVGIEASCFGVTTVTAGTGRYDRLGFTVDPSTCAEYLDLVGRIHEIQPITPTQVELARRFAYGMFIRRPTPITSIRFRFRPDELASLDISIANTFGHSLVDAADIRAIAEWIACGSEDFLTPLPAVSDASTHPDE